jgi:hypothetical protein
MAPIVRLLQRLFSFLGFRGQLGISPQQGHHFADLVSSPSGVAERPSAQRQAARGPQIELAPALANAPEGPAVATLDVAASPIPAANPAGADEDSHAGEAWLPGEDAAANLLDTSCPCRTAVGTAGPQVEARRTSWHANGDGSAYSLTSGGDLYWINDKGAEHFIDQDVTTFQAAADGTLCYLQSGGRLILWPARGGYLPVADGVTSFQLAQTGRVYCLRNNRSLYAYREGDVVTFQAGNVTAFQLRPDGRVFFLSAAGDLFSFCDGQANVFHTGKVRSFALGPGGQVLLVP